MGIPAHLVRGDALAGESRADAGLRVWRSLLAALQLSDLAGVSVFDIGCGDRLAHAIAEFDLATGSYTGVDNRKPLIDWLTANIPDSRCQFVHYDAQNARYWPGGQPFTKNLKLPGDRYDVLFAQSVFSHLYPHEADVMLYLARERVRDDGIFVLTGFLSDGVALFEDVHPEDPALRVYYHPAFFHALLSKNDWALERLIQPGEQGFGQGTQSALVCRPVSRTQSS